MASPAVALITQFRLKLVASPSPPSVNAFNAPTAFLLNRAEQTVPYTAGFIPL